MLKRIIFRNSFICFKCRRMSLNQTESNSEIHDAESILYPPKPKRKRFMGTMDSFLARCPTFSNPSMEFKQKQEPCKGQNEGEVLKGAEIY